MAARTRIDESPAKPKYRYQVKNWAEYDQALVNRGNLTIWFDEASIAENWTPPRPVGRGKPGLYSDVAIQTCLTLKTLFHLPYRATEGLLKSLMQVTTADWHDNEVFPDLLAQVEGDVAQVSADGAYDTEGAHAAIAGREAKATIPPREGAAFWGNDHPRDAILAEIAAKGREGWKEESGYHRRSLAENMMYRIKQLGDRLFSRDFDRQVAESHVRAAIINQFTYLGMPQSVRAGQIAPAA